MELRELSAREKKLVTIFIVVAVVMGSYYFFYAPQWERRSELEAEVESNLEELNSSSYQLRQIRLLREEIKLLEELRAEGVEFLDVGERNRLIVDLDEAALATGLNLSTINPASSREENEYLQYPINLRLRGEYGALLDFIKELADFDYLVRINTLNISSTGSLSSVINVEIEVVGYAFRGEED